jgi:hypothetical protein
MRFLASVARRFHAPRAERASQFRARRSAASSTRVSATKDTDTGANEMVFDASARVRTGKVVREEAVHSRYLTVYDRVVEFEAQAGDETGDAKTRRFAYDVVGHPKGDFKFVCVAPFHSRETTKSGEPEFTIVREYAQGSNSECIVLPSGCFERGKHSTMADVAVEELHEEARLTNAKIVKLIGDDNPGLLETKWCMNRLFPFLSIGGEECEDAVRDAEEFNMTHERVTVKEFKQLMYSGVVMMPSIVTGQLAIDHLLRNGLITIDDL